MNSQPEFTPYQLPAPSGFILRPLVILLLAVIVLLLGLFLQIFAQAQNIEIFKILNSYSDILEPGVWSFFTWLGDTSLLWPMLLPLMIKHPKAVVCAVISVPIGGCLSWFLKWLFNAPRPAGVLQLNEFVIIGPTLTEHGFPSGHTITAFAACVAVMLGVAWTKGVWTKVGPLTLVVAAFLIGLSRVMVGAHWPWDILAGAGVGCLAAVLSWFLLERYSHWSKNVNLHRSIALIFCGMAWMHLLSPLKELAYIWATVLSMALSSWGGIQFLRHSIARKV